jgi:hypothetical protein
LLGFLGTRDHLVVQREDLPAPQVAPDGGERAGSPHGMGLRRDERAIHRAG